MKVKLHENKYRVTKPNCSKFFFTLHVFQKKFLFVQVDAV